MERSTIHDEVVKDFKKIHLYFDNDLLEENSYLIFELFELYDWFVNKSPVTADKINKFIKENYEIFIPSFRKVLDGSWYTNQNNYSFDSLFVIFDFIFNLPSNAIQDLDDELMSSLSLFERDDELVISIGEFMLNNASKHEKQIVGVLQNIKSKIEEKITRYKGSMPRLNIDKFEDDRFSLYKDFEKEIKMDMSQCGYGCENLSFLPDEWIKKFEESEQAFEKQFNTKSPDRKGILINRIYDFIKIKKQVNKVLMKYLG